MYTTTQHQRTVLFTLFFVFAGILIPALTIAPQAISASEEFIVTKLEDIAGIWEAQHNGRRIYVQYREDGTYNIAYALENLQRSPWSSGRFWFEGNVYFQKGEHPLSSDFPGKYEILIHKEEGMPERLSLKVIDDATTGRVRDLTAGMIRVEPPGKIVNTAEDLIGTWEALLAGRKASMEFRKDGTYTTSSKSNSVPGKFWFEGEQFHMKCPYGQGAYTVQIQHASDKVTQLSFTLIEDEVSGRISDLAGGMSRVEP